MKRLTTDIPHDNFTTMLNFVYGKDGWAHIRSDGKNDDVPLTKWTKEQCLVRGCDEFPASTPEEIDQELCDCTMNCPECPIALAYCFATQAVHLRSRLKMYEDILFAEDGTELVSLDTLRGMVTPPPNDPLTLEELREMDGEPVWIAPAADGGKIPERWMLVSDYLPENRIFLFMPPGGMTQGYKAVTYGKTWLAYRRKEESK